MLGDEFTWIGDVSVQGTCCNCVGAGEKDLRFLVAHSPREVPVGCRDTLHRCVEASKRIHGSAQAGGARSVLCEADSGIFQNLPHRLAVPNRIFKFPNNLGGCRNAKGVNLDCFVLHYFGKGEEVASFSAGARIDIGPV